MQTKIHFFLKQGTNTFTFRDSSLKTSENSTMTLRKIFALWRFENVARDEQITLTAQDESITSVTLGEGYWGIEDIQKHLASEEVTLTANIHNNTCRISSSKFTVDLGSIGPLLGFRRGAVIQRDVTKDSNTVSINETIRYITVSSNLVDDRRVFHSLGDKSQVIAVLPVDTSQRLNGTTTDFGESEFTASKLQLR